jgi:hypothetical protein
LDKSVSLQEGSMNLLQGLDLTILKAGNAALLEIIKGCFFAANL